MNESREIECPACHHRQDESIHVISTVCRGCGESIAPPAVLASRGLRRSGRAAFRATTGKIGEQWATVTRCFRAPTIPVHLRPGPWMTVSAIDPRPPSEEGDLMESSDRRQVACPYCQTTAWLPASALTDCCGACQRHYPLRDYAFSGTIHADIITAGRLVIHHGAHLVASSIRCGELLVHGRTTGALTVSGSACYHGEGETLGEVHCGHLVITRRSRRIFHQRIFAMAADITGKLQGDLWCAGRLRVPRGAEIDGDVLAGQVILEAGGRINGSVGTLPTVVPRPDAVLPASARALLHQFGQDSAERDAGT